MIIILYNIRSCQNVGSIFRTADALGVEKLYLCGITPDPIDRFKKPRTDITKASLGAEKTVVWEHIGKSIHPQKTISLIKKLKKDGYCIVSLEQDKKSVTLFSYKHNSSKKIALIVGNEVAGVPRSILSYSDTIVEIPMYGTKESLNVAVAFGIAGYQLTQPKNSKNHKTAPTNK
jgi:tRNA G18 (ribose-2'-O)-methylase SpoU